MNTSGIDDLDASFLERTYTRMPDWSIPGIYQGGANPKEKVLSGVRLGLQNLGFFPVFTSFLLLEGAVTTRKSLQKIPSKVKESSQKRVNAVKEKIRTLMELIQK